METVVVEQDTGAGVHVREGVLGLAVLHQDAGGDLAVHLDQLEERGGGDGGTAAGVGHQGVEAGIGLAEHGVAVTGDDTAAVEGRPEVVLDAGGGGGGADVLLHLEDPAEDFLSGEAGVR